MAFPPPRNYNPGSRLPQVRKVSSIRQTPSETTTMTSITTTSRPQSTRSSARPTSCGGTTPCGSGGAQSRLRTPAARAPATSSIGRPRTCPGSAGRTPSSTPSSGTIPEIVVTSSSIIMDESGMTTTTRTEERTIPNQSLLRPPTVGRSSGLRPPAGVCPGSALPKTPAPRPSGMRPPGGVCPGSAQPKTPAPRPSGLRPPGGVCPGSVQYKTPAARPSRSGIPQTDYRESTQREERAAQPTRRLRTPSGYPSSARSLALPTPGSARFGSGRPSKTPRGPSPAEARRLLTGAIPRIPGYSLARPPSTESASSMMTPIPSTAAIPKVRKEVVGKASKSSSTCSKKTTVTQEVTKIVPPAIPEGRYALSLKYAPHTKEGKWAKFSSPPGIRRKMDEQMPKGIKASIMPPEYKGLQDIRKLTTNAPYKDTISCSLDVRHGRGAAPPGYYADPHDYSFLESHVEPEYGSPYAPRESPEEAAAVEASQQTILEQDVERRLYEIAAASPPDKVLKVSGSRKSPGTPHVIMTDRGPVTATEQVITEKRVEKTPGSEKISRHITGIEQQGCGAVQLELDTQSLEPGGLPKRGEKQMEAVSVMSSVAIAPGGIKETTTTVIYETTQPPDRINISPEDVERMVDEETIDIDKTKRFKPLHLKIISPMSYAIRKREHELLMNYASVLEIEQAVVTPEPNPDQEQEEVPPETMASILHTEEQGHRLHTQPAEMYDHLFPESYESNTITVSSVAPAPWQDVLIPSKLPDSFHTSQGITQELENIATTTPHEAAAKPEGDVFSETVLTADKRTPVRNVARRGNRLKLTDVPLLSREMPPWAVEDLQPIIEIVGASPNASNLPPRAEATRLVVEPVADKIDEEEVEEEQQVEEEPELLMEYTIRLEAPTHSSRVQLRGSSRPPWFPGYYVALPEIPGLVRVDKTPKDVLNHVWNAVQPRFFPDDSIITI